MNIKQLNYFVAVATHLSFTKAAKTLFVSQPALSKQIAELEKEVGVQLFVRSRHAVKLTPAGGAFLRQAIHLLNEWSEGVETARRISRGTVGGLAVGFLGPPLRMLLPAIVRDFRDRYPKIDIRLKEMNKGPLLDDLLSGKLDTIFTMNLGISGIKNLAHEHIYTDDTYVVLPDSHPRARDRVLRLQDLASEPFVFISRQESPQGFYATYELCLNSGFTPNIVAETDFIETVLVLVECGIGISVLPGCLKPFAGPSLRFVPLVGGSIFEVVVVWDTTNPNPSVPLFLDVVRRQVALVRDQGRLPGEGTKVVRL
jgi:DNA-binding transcriptional LysR family regulator